MTTKEYAERVLSDGAWHKFRDLIGFDASDRRYRDSARVLDGHIKRGEIKVVQGWDDFGNSLYKLESVRVEVGSARS